VAKQSPGDTPTTRSFRDSYDEGIGLANAYLDAQQEMEKEGQQDHRDKQLDALPGGAEEEIIAKEARTLERELQAEEREFRAAEREAQQIAKEEALVDARVRQGRENIRPQSVPKIEGPDFPDLSDHARRHGGGMRPNQYYNEAVRNMNQRGNARFNIFHDGKRALASVKRLGPDTFLYTAGDRSGRTIFTHMVVKGQYLKNCGITLPSGF
jgi:hypothetical protein